METTTGRTNDTATAILREQNDMRNMNTPLLSKSMEQHYYSEDDDDVLQQTNLANNSTEIDCWISSMLCFCFPKAQRKTKSKLSYPVSLSTISIERSPITTLENRNPLKAKSKLDKNPRKSGIKYEKDRNDEYERETAAHRKVVSCIDDNEFLDALDNHDSNNTNHGDDDLSVEIQKEHFYLPFTFFSFYSTNHNKGIMDDTTQAPPSELSSSDESPALESSSGTCYTSGVSDTPESQRSRRNDSHDDTLNHVSYDITNRINQSVDFPKHNSIVQNNVPSEHAFLLVFLKNLLRWMFISQITNSILSMGLKRKQPVIEQSYEKDGKSSNDNMIQGTDNALT